MADCHDNSASNTQDISADAPRVSAPQQEDVTSDSLFQHLKVIKSKVCCVGTFSELI